MACQKIHRSSPFILNKPSKTSSSIFLLPAKPTNSFSNSNTLKNPLHFYARLIMFLLLRLFLLFVETSPLLPRLSATRASPRGLPHGSRGRRSDPLLSREPSGPRGRSPKALPTSTPAPWCACSPLPSPSPLRIANRTRAVWRLVSWLI